MKYFHSITHIRESRSGMSRGRYAVQCFIGMLFCFFPSNAVFQSDVDYFFSKGDGFLKNFEKIIDDKINECFGKERPITKTVKDMVCRDIEGILKKTTDDFNETVAKGKLSLQQLGDEMQNIEKDVIGNFRSALHEGIMVASKEFENKMVVAKKQGALLFEECSGLFFYRFLTYFLCAVVLYHVIDHGNEYIKKKLAEQYAQK